jgi:hypothetical protein
MRKYLIIILLSIISISIQSQELNCNITVMAPTITGVDKRVFETLKTAIQDFVNNRKWTEDAFLNQERIDCSMQINIQSSPGSGEYYGTIQIQARRPVFGSSYNSPLLTYFDDSFNFSYQENQPLDYNDMSDQMNLTSMIAFYSYIIVGLDYDSYSLNGGSVYLQKAQNVVNFCQGDNEKGWKAYESTRNRYWYITNLLDPQFKGVREASYKFHRSGLDIMSEKADDGRKSITESLDLVKAAFDNQPGSFLFKVFFDTKSDELVNIYSQGLPDEKNKVYTYLNSMDPANGTKYQKIISGK